MRTRRVIERLRDFWFEPAPATRLATLRILVGAFVVWFFFTAQDSYLQVAQTDPRLFAPVGVVFGGPVSVETFQWLTRLTIVAAVCLTLGLGHRFTGPACAALALWL